MGRRVFESRTATRSVHFLVGSAALKSDQLAAEPPVIRDEVPREDTEDGDGAKYDGCLRADWHVSEFPESCR